MPLLIQNRMTAVLSPFLQDLLATYQVENYAPSLSSGRSLPDADRQTALLFSMLAQCRVVLRQRCLATLEQSLRTHRRDLRSPRSLCVAHECASAFLEGLQFGYRLGLSFPRA